MLSLAFTLFLLMDSIGNIPFYISFLKKVPPHRQYWVIFREMLIALFVILLFSYVGEQLMIFLGICHNAIQIAGGIILFLICLKMIFPDPHNALDDLPHDNEPFIVPLAVPLVAGPAVLAAVMIYSRQAAHYGILLGAIVIAWVASLLVTLLAPLFQRALGWRGIVATERLMGLILALIAVQMFLNGLHGFLNLPPS
jgi:multiple antibiotic resistance protein